MHKLSAVLIAFISLLLFSNLSYADAGDRKVRLSGNLQDNVDKKQSVKKLEQQFTLYTKKFYNPWEKASATYSGILLDEFVKKFGQADTNKITFKAIDDYQVDIPKNIWQSYKILLVTKVNGEYLDIKNKGPMRIVFPDYDASKKEYEVNLPLWLWMITQIEFLE